MTLAYVDTSVLLRHILGEPGAHFPLNRFADLYASELLKVEALRTIDRLRIHGRWSDREVTERIQLLTAVSAAIHEIPIQPPILRRASDPFPIVVRTLDALHIATALLMRQQIGRPLQFLTHDRRQAEAALAAGLKVPEGALHLDDS